MVAMTARDPYFDNLKFILIFFVVIGHVIEAFALLGDPFFYDFKSIYMLIYTFHMPLFIMVAGYFSKRGDEDWWRRRAFNFFLLYSAFTLIHFSIRCVFSSASYMSIVKSAVLFPFGALWFLLSFVVWHLVTPYVIKMKLHCLIAVGVALAAGYFDFFSRELTLSRTIVFYPFFLLGYSIKGYDVKKILIGPQIAAVCLVIAALMTFYISPSTEIRWLFGDRSYSQLGHSEWFAVVYRFALYIVWIFMSLMVASVIPKKTMFFTQWGRNTLYVLLFHDFFYRYLERFGVYQLIDSTTAKVVLVASAVVVCVVLSSSFVSKFAAGVIEFDYYSYVRKKFVDRREIGI